jgi:hypothetical protein
VFKDHKAGKVGKVLKVGKASKDSRDSRDTKVELEQVSRDTKEFKVSKDSFKLDSRQETLLSGTVQRGLQVLHSFITMEQLLV